MKKKILISVILAAACVLCMSFAFACGGGKSDFSSVSFKDETVVYDGEEHVIEISGTLPEGATVEYTNNKGTDAGTYSATAVLSGEGYKTTTLTAVLTIKKAEITGVTLSDQSIWYDGDAHSLEIVGDLPEGVSVKYENNGVKEAGEYTVTATISGKNFETLVLEAILRIDTAATVATSILNSLLVTPDPWSFLPSGLQRENMAYTSMPVTDFSSSFVNVSSIGTRVVGLQLNDLYTILGYADTVLTYMGYVTSIGATIADVFQQYINQNQDNFAEFSGEAGGFKLKILLDGHKYELLAGNSYVSVELYYDGTTGERSGRVQATDGVALKYTYSDSYLRMGFQLTVLGVGVLYEIEFTRGASSTTGYLYQYYGAKSVAVKSTVVMYSTSSYTYVMAQEDDDREGLSVDAFMEVYNTSTGKYMGGEVLESILSVDYDTLWFQLSDVTGITSIKTDGTTTYLNGVSGTAFTPTYNTTAFGLVKTSRRYDIELKTVYYIVKDDNGYSKVEAKIPMIFVQVGNVSTFANDIKSDNSKIFGSTVPVLPSSVMSVIESSFDIIHDLYSTIKEQMSYDDITGFIGDKDEFFD